MPSTSLQSELAVLRESAAFAEITDRAFLCITGSDATRWLNGMVTNNIAALAPGEGNYNFLLNAQGRIQGDCTIYREPGEGAPTFLLETDNSQLETIHQTLDKFIIMDDVELSTAYEKDSGLVVIGPDIASLLLQFGMPIKGLFRISHITLGEDTASVLTRAYGEIPRCEIYASKQALDTLANRLELPTVSSEALEAHRILTGIPKFGVDIRDRDLPQETAQTHALHFAKGCYLGQEIVERIRSRGQVHRTFAQFSLTGELPTLPTALTAGEKPVGELTSAVRIGDEIIALGYIRREILDTHAAITYPGGTATPRT